MGAVAAGWVWGRATGARFPESDHRFWHLKPACRGRRGAGQGFRCRSVRLPAVQNTGLDAVARSLGVLVAVGPKCSPPLRFSVGGHDHAVARRHCVCSWSKVRGEQDFLSDGNCAHGCALSLLLTGASAS